MTLERKKELIRVLMGKNYLITPDLINNIPDDFDYDYFFTEGINHLEDTVNPIPIQYSVLDSIISNKSCSSDDILKNNDVKTSVEIIRSYDEVSKKREIQHFVSYFKARYEKMKSLLLDRQELQNAVSIKRALEKPPKEKVSLIGLVSEKRVTKNGHLIIELEDPTGKMNILVNKDNEMYDEAKDIVLDETIGISGVSGEGIIFSNELLFPDIPISKELKKSQEEVYAAFISDIHVGSNMFLPDDFMRFINWINGAVEDGKQRNVGLKVKYLFVVGDIVDGVGIYPGQDKELLIKDITEQYKKCAEYLSMIRKDVHIIICGGNHDAMRIAEPQPPLNKSFAKAIYDLPNVHIVSNPSMIRIHASEKFPGFDVLLYHGYSFDYYMANVDSIRTGGGYDRADLMMRFLLQRRHLAPTHASTLYIPDTEKDPLVIDIIPDFFVTGHIHKTNISTYRNVSNISCSCWQAKTSFQEKVGHNPEPSRVPVVNLQTRQTNIILFGGEE